MDLKPDFPLTKPSSGTTPYATMVCKVVDLEAVHKIASDIPGQDQTDPINELRPTLQSKSLHDAVEMVAKQGSAAAVMCQNAATRRGFRDTQVRRNGRRNWTLIQAVLETLPIRTGDIRDLQQRRKRFLSGGSGMSRRD